MRRITSAPSPRPRPSSLAGALALIAAAAFFFAPYRHFTTDDAFIHYRFAENVAAGRGFSYNPGVPTYGDTSPLWVFLLVAVAPLAGGVPQAAKLIAAVSLAAALLLFATLARKWMPVPRWAGAAVTALFLLDPWLLKWGLSGMETPLAVAAVLGALLLRDRARRAEGSGSGQHLEGLDPWTPLVLGAGTLVRPECVFLAVALAVDIAAAGGRRRLANLALLAGMMALAIMPWLLYAKATFGVFFPNTLAARRDLEYSAAYRAAKMAKILASAYALPVGAIAAGLVLRRSLLARREVISPLLGAVLVLGFYLVWGVSVGARYLLLVTPFLVLVGYAALIELLAARPRLRLAALAGSAAVLIGVQGWSVRFVTAWPAGMDPRLFEIARWLRDRTAPDAVVAAHEIGVLGYVSERRMLDLAGLVSPEVEPVSRTGSVAESLASALRRGAPTPDYLVWNSNVYPDHALLSDLAGRLEPLLTREVQREGSSHGGGSQMYTIYRLRNGESPIGATNSTPAPPPPARRRP